jgi:hypothetical protein
MNTALRVYSWDGWFLPVAANEISSAELARHWGPFTDPDKKSFVSWVRKSKTGKTAHFRLLNGLNNSYYETWIENYKRKKNNSILHHTCRDRLRDGIKELIGGSLKFYFIDRKISDFYLTGNLLRGVESVETEYKIQTPLGVYQLDIALLGKEINNQKIILGAVELEYSHKFDFFKSIVCKCMGFKLISIDISNFQESDLECNINKDSLVRILVETTTSEINKLTRKNFVYLHTLLYPLFLKGGLKNSNAFSIM